MNDPQQAEILAQLESWRQAVAARDVERVMSFYAEKGGFLGFDFVPPFVLSGWNAFRTQWETTFRQFDGDPLFELKDIVVSSDGDLAIAHGLSHFVGSIGGRAIDIWTRQTNALRRFDGRWLMIHEHVSVPIDLHTMTGVLDYTP